MSSSLKYLLLVAPAALMIAILFLYPLGCSLVSAFTAPGQPFTLDHFRKVYALYASDVLFSLLIVLISVALLALLAIILSAGMERDSDHLCLEATGLCHAADLRGDGGAGVVADPCCT